MNWEKELDQTAFDLCEQKRFREAAEYSKEFIRVTIPKELYDLTESGQGKEAYAELQKMYPGDVLNRLAIGEATLDDFFVVHTADLFVLVQGESFLLPDSNGKIEYIHLMRRMRFEPETYLNFVEEEVYRLYRNMIHLREQGR